jgi:hypothetical protein
LCLSSSSLWKCSGGGGFVQLLKGDRRCTTDGCDRKLAAKGLCIRCYQNARYKPKPKAKKEQIKCRSCSGFFTPNRDDQVYCCGKCRVREKQREKRGSKPRDEIRSYTCVHCGGGYESSSVLKTIYCSNKCKVGAWVKANPGRTLEHRGRAYQTAKQKVLPHSKVFFNTCRVCSKDWTGQTSGVVCSAGCAKTEANMRAVEYAERQHKAAAKTISCGGCSCLFSPLYGSSNAIYCQPCADEQKRRQNAIHRAARKAKQLAVTVEKVDPYKVFARDKWHCQECGVSTPHSLRGSYNDDAPELDHIKPLSKGGEHSYRNTQCLCRRCNQEKSDTWQPQGEESLLQA